MQFLSNADEIAEVAQFHERGPIVIERHSISIKLLYILDTKE
jgi:hypothetical protein